MTVVMGNDTRGILGDMIAHDPANFRMRVFGIGGFKLALASSLMCRLSTENKQKRCLLQPNLEDDASEGPVAEAQLAAADQEYGPVVEVSRPFRSRPM